VLLSDFIFVSLATCWWRGECVRLPADVALWTHCRR